MLLNKTQIKKFDGFKVVLKIMNRYHVDSYKTSSNLWTNDK